MALPESGGEAMTQTTLQFTGKRNKFDGAEYQPKHDEVRLTRQILQVYLCLENGEWRTLREISLVTSAPEASVSAQIRNLRKARFGGHVIERRRRGEPKHGCWEYKLTVQS